MTEAAERLQLLACYARVRRDYVDAGVSVPPEMVLREEARVLREREREVRMDSVHIWRAERENQIADAAKVAMLEETARWDAEDERVVAAHAATPDRAKAAVAIAEDLAKLAVKNPLRLELRAERVQRHRHEAIAEAAAREPWYWVDLAEQPGDRTPASAAAIRAEAARAVATRHQGPGRTAAVDVSAAFIARRAPVPEGNAARFAFSDAYAAVRTILETAQFETVARVAEPVRATRSDSTAGAFTRANVARLLEPQAHDVLDSDVAWLDVELERIGLRSHLTAEKRVELAKGLLLDVASYAHRRTIARGVLAARGFEIMGEPVAAGFAREALAKRVLDLSAQEVVATRGDGGAGGQLGAPAVSVRETAKGWEMVSVAGAVLQTFTTKTAALDAALAVVRSSSSKVAVLRDAGTHQPNGAWRWIHAADHEDEPGWDGSKITERTLDAAAVDLNGSANAVPVDGGMPDSQPHGSELSLGNVPATGWAHYAVRSVSRLGRQGLHVWAEVLADVAEKLDTGRLAFASIAVRGKRAPDGEILGARFTSLALLNRPAQTSLTPHSARGETVAAFRSSIGR